MPERRTSPRVQAYRPVRVHKTTAPRVIESLTKDLSAGGVRCLSPTMIPVSTPVTVDIVLSNSHDTFTVTGKAMWFRMIPHSEQFDLGIAFSDLSPQNKRRLSVYLADLASKSPLVPA